MNREDFDLLNRLFHTVEELEQRSGDGPEREHPSSIRLSEDLVRFADDVRSGRLKGRARKRAAGQLFRRIIAAHPEIWRT